MKRIVAFGEVLLRLAPPGHERVERAESFAVRATGPELVVAAALARLGIPATVVTVLPDTPVGKLAAAEIRRAGVGDKYIFMKNEGRMGLVFVEAGIGRRIPLFFSDREGTAFGRLKDREVPWEKVFPEFDHFHISEVTPTLSKVCMETTKDGLARAKRLGLSTSLSVGGQGRVASDVLALETITPLMEKVDHLVTTARDAARVFRVKNDNHEAAARELLGRYNLESCALIFRDEDPTGRVRLSCVAVTPKGAFAEKPSETAVVDPSGAAEAFAAGYILGILAGDIGTGLRAGRAMAALAYTLGGDMTVCDETELAEVPGLGDILARLRR
jgi:2-dehydro-3-deoxygluconokinase